jgi:hypothetical protein
VDQSRISLPLSLSLRIPRLRNEIAVFLAFPAVSQTAETGRTCSCFHLATLRQDHKQDSIRIRVSCRNALNIAARRLPLSFSFGLSFSPSLIVCILIRGARSRADYGQMELLTRTRPLDDKRVRERALIKYYIREGFIRRE